MKTRQEQIEAMKLAIPQTIVAYDMNPKGQHLYGEQRLQIAEALIQAGFGNVSEYKAEIRELKSYLDHQIDATNDAENLASHLQYDLDEARAQLKTQKQAQIDVLNKAKEKLDSAPNGWAYTGYIDDLIEEVENETR